VYFTWKGLSPVFIYPDAVLIYLICSVFYPILYPSASADRRFELSAEHVPLAHIHEDLASEVSVCRLLRPLEAGEKKTAIV
jgi:hypothetical protein